MFFVSGTTSPLTYFLIAAFAHALFHCRLRTLFFIAACAAGPLPKGRGDLLLQSKKILL